MTMQQLPVVLSVCIVLFCNISDEVFGCYCLLRHQQTHFCDAQFVIRAKALSVELVPGKNSSDGSGLPIELGNLKYTVEVIETFKGIVKPKEIELFTADNSAACGVFLNTTGKLEYLLTVTYAQGKLRIGLCGWNSEWSKLSNCIKARLDSDDISPGFPSTSSNLYRNNCERSKCEVKFCSPTTGEDCMKTDDTCVTTGVNTRANDICSRRTYGKRECRWIKCSIK